MDLGGKHALDLTVPISDSQLITIKIKVPALRAQGLNLLPWASSYVLASLLHKLPIMPPLAEASRIPILELGAGIGLVGLVGSMLWRQRAVLTDLEPIVPGLTANIELNAALLRQYGGSATAGTLDWDTPDTLTLHGKSTFMPNEVKANVILAADTVYSEEHPRMITQTVARWLAPGGTLVITYPLRVAYLDQIRDLWEKLEGAGLESTAEGKQEASEVGGGEWDDERLCEWSVWRWR
ncbi:hypothetical protein BU23DRAFT_511710, partial [Bimuria novae-zelandiae CBS 107.79]